ncbi:MAG: gliding motility-associated C-terminal domain-containing protein [Prevotellaceae bacterium]|nr:gliding motility-associated C-terminal domain-containing protein [Prevotellaceae bacterium]
MKRIYVILLLLFPLAAQAQLRAPDADKEMPTTYLSEKEDIIFVFYDKLPTQLVVTDSLCAAADAACSAPSTFTWTKLNIVDTTLDIVYVESHASSSTYSFPVGGEVEGGYRVTVSRADTTLSDTFTTWIFVDTFRINGVAYTNDCESVRLEVNTTPEIYTSYPVYNFEEVLQGLKGKRVLRGGTVAWTPSVDIHAGVDEPDESWMNGNTHFTLINNPPPLYSASYTVKVTDVFGKEISYTTPYVVEAIAAYPKMTVEQYDKERDDWSDASNEDLKGEALFRLRFSHNQCINTDKYIWKGTADSLTNGGKGYKTPVWVDSTQSKNAVILPRTPYKGRILDGYTPGKYKVRLTAINTRSGCVDSTEKLIVVDPSSFQSDAIPNAFTPNGDNRNDFFIFVDGSEPISMEYVNVYIYNRSGGLVYRYEGRADEWKGWNGRYLNTGNDLGEGVYFYVINAEGWDSKMYNDSQYKGAVHLFR